MSDTSRPFRLPKSAIVMNGNRREIELSEVLIEGGPFEVPAGNYMIVPGHLPPIHVPARAVIRTDDGEQVELPAGTWLDVSFDVDVGTFVARIIDAPFA